MSEKKKLTPEETFALAVQNHQKNNLQVAEKLYKEILKINPNHAMAHSNLGNVLLELRKYQKAIICYQKAIQIQPNRASTHNNLGVIFNELGKNKKAIICYQKAIQIEPNYADAHNNLGEIFNELGKNKKALHSSLGAEFFVDDYEGMEGNGNHNEYSNEHPIVRTHPETRKKILFVNWTYTKKIVGMDKKESDEILNKIFKHQARLDFTCRFQWTENAVAIWDNRSVQHYAIADFFPGRGLGHERVMDRIAIQGDKPN